MQNIKQIQKIYNMSIFFSKIETHAQARMSRNKYSGGRRAYAAGHARAGERVEILTESNELIILSLLKTGHIHIA